jgi:hypothetical protein
MLPPMKARHSLSAEGGLGTAAYVSLRRAAPSASSMRGRVAQAASVQRCAAPVRAEHRGKTIQRYVFDARPQAYRAVPNDWNTILGYLRQGGLSAYAATPQGGDGPHVVVTRSIHAGGVVGTVRVGDLVYPVHEVYFDYVIRSRNPQTNEWQDSAQQHYLVGQQFGQPEYLPLPPPPPPPPAQPQQQVPR